MRISTSFLLASFLMVSAGRAAETHVIELKNGTKIVGTIQKQEGGKVYIDAELLGQVVVDATALVTTETAAEAATPPASVKTAPAVVVPPSGAPAEVPKTDPNKVTWKRSLSINGSYNSAAYVQGPIPGAAGTATGVEGRSLGLSGKQQTVQINGMIIRASPTMALTLTGGYGYADYEPAGKVVDNYNGEFTYTHILSPKTYVLTRSTYKVDHIALIDHSFEQVAGYGFKLVDTDRTHLDVIPGVSEVNETKGTRFDDKWIFSAGFLENLDFAFNERVSLNERFKYRVGVKDTDVWAINSYLGINSALSEHISLNVGLTYNYDNTLGPVSPQTASTLLALGVAPADILLLRPAKKDQLQLTTGIEFNF
ncbi:MAG TPA: DUF481 domain-containing protein [Opitutaceae bacterium]|nr:DUF481 domain-containing protein [Opitutaceae bacterium]